MVNMKIQIELKGSWLRIIYDDDDVDDDDDDDDGDGDDDDRDNKATMTTTTATSTASSRTEGQHNSNNNRDILRTKHYYMFTPTCSQFNNRDKLDFMLMTLRRMRFH